MFLFILISIIIPIIFLLAISSAISSRSESFLDYIDERDSKRFKKQLKSIQLIQNANNNAIQVQIVDDNIKNEPHHKLGDILSVYSSAIINQNNNIADNDAMKYATDIFKKYAKYGYSFACINRNKLTDNVIKKLREENIAVYYASNPYEEWLLPNADLLLCNRENLNIQDVLLFVWSNKPLDEVLPRHLRRYGTYILSDLTDCSDKNGDIKKIINN
jgi:hypothetical protein